MSGKQKKSNTSASKKRAAAERRQARKNVGKNSTLVLIVTAVAIIGIFVGRWVVAIGNGYYEAFVEPFAGTVSAVNNMQGLAPGAEERETMLPVQKEFDLYTGARLRDEVTMTASDGVTLHGYLYNENSDVTVLAVPRFYVDGTADFLPAPSLYGLTGCNLLLIDARSQGGSEGQYFTWGMTEQRDIVDWMNWADETFGKQTFILWGEGTGANTLLFAAANGLLPESAAFIVAESPYASLRQAANDHIWKWYNVPRSFLYAIEGKLNSSGAGFTLDDIELADALKEGYGAVPVLFLESSRDTYIRPAWTEAVFESYTGVKELISGGATHGTVYTAEREAIDALLADWWNIYGE